MLRTGFIGWRGMVGSVLTERMSADNSFQGIESHLFSTSQAGETAPNFGQTGPDLLADAHSIDALKDMDVILTCQGGEYTKKMLPSLLAEGWKGYWIDAASTMRMDDSSVIVLDPINRQVIDNALTRGSKIFTGGNCTVSLMLMAVGELFIQGHVEWLSSMTYQAASGAGAKNMEELVAQMKTIGDASAGFLEPGTSILELDRKVTSTINDSSFPVENFGGPLAGSLLPWIDTKMENGQTREEWKGQAETNKILMNETPVPVDGICVRVSSMRSHSQALTIKLKDDIPLDEIEDMVARSNEWVSVIPNAKEDTIQKLTPAAVSGTLSVPVGRMRKMNMGPEYLSAFTVGDQLLWGAAEPLKRMLSIVREYKGE
jgi:aspartate-semialdehyde dehydrogenase